MIKNTYRLFITFILITILDKIIPKKFSKLVNAYFLLQFFAMLYLRFYRSKHRQSLEKIITQLNKGSPEVLLIGMKSYNMHYAPYWRFYGKIIVIEPNECFVLPKNVDRSFDKIQDFRIMKKYDIIDISGVYGYGLNERKDIKKALSNLLSISHDQTKIIFDLTLKRDPLDIYQLLKCLDKTFHQVLCYDENLFCIRVLDREYLRKLCDML